MKYIFFIFLILSSFVFTACSGGGSAGASSQSPFRGMWFSDEILAYKESKDPEIICDNIENNEWTNYQNELLIDGFIIDFDGSVYDFSINNFDKNVMFKVSEDGTTFDNMFLNNDGNCENCEDLIGFTMEIVGDDKLINTVEYKTEDKEVEKSSIEYVKMNESEISEIKNIVNSCNAFKQDIYDKCIASGVKSEKCQETSNI